jgi:transposase
MLFVGLDYHVKRSSLCVLDENGKKLLQRDVMGSWIKVIDALKQVKKKQGEGQQMSICYEASCGYGFLHDELKSFCRRVVVAHPGQLRLIFRSKRKNDRIDAYKLATLLFLDQVPMVWVPDPDIRAWRQTIEYRNRLVRKRARVKNEIRALLRSYGIVKARGLWTKRGISWLSELELPDEFSCLKLHMLLDELDHHVHQIKEVEKKLNRYSKSKPVVILLMTIPGIGVRTAESLAAYIGDPSRFGSASKAASYFGIVPCLDSSAGKDRYGHITKAGPPTARRLLVEASWVAVRRSAKVKAYYERVMKGDPDRKKIAIVAVAHYLLRVSLAMMKNGEVWDEAA